MKSTKSMDPLPVQEFELFSDYSDSEVYMSNRNLSTTLFTGVTGSLDHIISSNLAADEDDRNINDNSDFSIGGLPNGKIAKSSSLTFNEDFGLSMTGRAALPLTQSTYDFRAVQLVDQSGSLLVQDDQSPEHGKVDNSSNGKANMKAKHKSLNFQGFKAPSILRELSDDEIVDSFASFMEACKTIRINPKEIGLLPSELWDDYNAEMPFDQIVNKFFLPRGVMRLPMKLFNALKISQLSPIFEPLVGATWLTDEIIRINVQRFARLINVQDPNRVLFSSNGFLTKIGFQEMNLTQLNNLDPDVDLVGVDLIHVKLIFHPSHKFKQDSKIEDLLSIRVPTI